MSVSENGQDWYKTAPEFVCDLVSLLKKKKKVPLIELIDGRVSWSLYQSHKSHPLDPKVPPGKVAALKLVGPSTGM